MEIPSFTSQYLHINQIQNEGVDSDLFPLRRGKIKMGVLVKNHTTPSFILPRQGEGN